MIRVLKGDESRESWNYVRIMLGVNLGTDVLSSMIDTR